MNGTVRVLIVGDAQDDVAPLVRMLSKNGFSPHYRLVDRGADMASALSDEPWDAVVADWHLSGFPGEKSLSVLKGSGQNLPYIALSDLLDVETAVEAIKSGADDFVLKSNLLRLVSALQREIPLARERRRAKREQERTARRANDRHKSARQLGALEEVSTQDILVPLRKILTFTDRVLSLCEEHLPPQALNYLIRVRSSALALRDVLDRIFAAQGREMEHGRTVDLRRALSEAVQGLKEVLEENDATVLHKSLPVVPGDHARMVGMFQTFLENLLKLKEAKRSPVLCFHAEVLPPGKGGKKSRERLCRILVEQDTPLPEDFLKQLCAPPRLPTLKQAGGTPLSACKDLVESHGGKMSAKPSKKGGCEFTFLLPLPIKPAAKSSRT
ncbi:MAG: response regulator [Deltaproteobacteria bacterium]|nr:response regulator [Deltaproteobacteria bacterium]